MEKKKDYKLIQHNLVYHIQGVLSPTKYAAAKNGNIKNGGLSDIIIPSFSLFNGKQKQYKIINWFSKHLYHN